MALVTVHATSPPRDAIPPNGEVGHFLALARRWPGREAQIRALLAHLGAPNQAAKSLLICGAPASGKTAVVRCGAVSAQASIHDSNQLELCATQRSPSVT